MPPCSTIITNAPLPDGGREGRCDQRPLGLWGGYCGLRQRRVARYLCNQLGQEPALPQTITTGTFTDRSGESRRNMGNWSAGATWAITMRTERLDLFCVRLCHFDRDNLP